MLWCSSFLLVGSIENHQSDFKKLLAGNILTKKSGDRRKKNSVYRNKVYKNFWTGGRTDQIWKKKFIIKNIYVFSGVATAERITFG